MNPGIPLALFDEVDSSSRHNCERRSSTKLPEDSTNGESCNSTISNNDSSSASSTSTSTTTTTTTMKHEISNVSGLLDSPKEADMAPNLTSASTGVLYEDESLEETQSRLSNKIPESKPPYRRRLVWINIVIFALLHMAAIYGAYLSLTSARIYTVILAFILYQWSGLGITAGAHRLWAHRAYKATWQLKIILMLFNTMAFQNTVIEWARDHRVHHKYSETDADPHNARRGFFFAHVGWLLCKKHPDVSTKGKGIDLSDLEEDPILRFQEKHYAYFMPLMCFVLPTIVPVYLWNETWSNAFFVSTVFRYVFTLNVTWLVNSAAHIFGGKPYDKFINPSQNKMVSLMALGEGWHNYHHVFPWDYKTAELGNYKYNTTTAFIDFFAWLGWAYDLKRVSTDIIQKRVERTGDGSHEVWGWGDKDQPQEERDGAILIYPESEKQK